MTISIELDYPREHDGKLLSALTLRRSTARDQMAVAKAVRAAGYGLDDNLAMTLFTVAQLSGLPVEVIEGLDSVDFVRAGTEIDRFFVASASRKKK